MIINDGSEGKGIFEIDYKGPWVHEKGYNSRFEGGDEHWITNAQFGSNFPSFIFRFIGTSVTIYGHKVPDGAIVDVFLDGTKIGEIDYYNPFRIEKTVLFKTCELENKEHVIQVILSEKKNPDAGNRQEASIDYIEVFSPTGFPVKGIVSQMKTIFLLTGMDCTLEYFLTPLYANVFPKILFSSSDESIATVDENGKITAIREGETVITLQPEGIDSIEEVNVTVKSDDGMLSGFVADDSTRSPSNKYFDILESNYCNNKYNLHDTAFLSDTVNSRIVIYSKNKAVYNVNVFASDFTTDLRDILPKECIDLKFMSEVFAHDSHEYIADSIYGG